MSRCFTSTPALYSRNWANGQNLVESTKIGKEIVASKKVHRKEKKEKKKEKKLKNEKSFKQQYFQTISDESEQLEKSCVTEEEEQHHHVGYLSDGSQNSKKKRRREASPAVESNIRATPVVGKPLRIRFVFKKPKEADVVPLEEPVCSTSASVITSSVSDLKTSDHEQNLLSVPSEPKKRSKHKPSKESRYNTLFDDLVPPCISLEEDNSEDWLSSTTRRQESVFTKSSIKNDEHMFMNVQISGDSLLPRAPFFSEVGIFALPYTVPF